jgi:hypothetical protein
MMGDGPIKKLTLLKPAERTKAERPQLRWNTRREVDRRARKNVLVAVKAQTGLYSHQ